MSKAIPEPRVAWAGLAVVLITLLSGVVVEASAQAGGPLAAYRWKNRPLLVFAPTANHLAYGEQIRRVNADRAGFRERDMVLVEAVGDRGDATALRTRFRVKPDDFAVILVGKDGGSKDRWNEPTSMDEVFRLIDGMPMRQREMRRGEP